MPPAPFQLVRVCALPVDDPSGDAYRARLERLAGEIADWDAVLRLAHRHGLLPLVARRLQGVRGAPEGVRRRLAEGAGVVALHNRFLCQRLFVVLDALEAVGANALVYKGPALALLAMGDLELRSFSDLDLLVPRRRAAAALTALERLGFRHTEGGRPDDPASYHARFDHPERVTVEIHWGIASPHVARPIDPEAWFAAPERLELLGRAVASPPLEPLLLALAIHGAKHLWLGLGWVADVAWLLRRRQPDLERVLREAERVRARRAALVALELAAIQLETPLPPTLPRDPGGQRLAREFAALQASEREPGAWYETRLLVRLRERPDDKARVLARAARRALEPTPEQRAALPGALRFLAPALQPFRLAAKALRSWHSGAS